MQRPENWTDTYAKHLKADGERALEPSDLETFALAAYMTGMDAESFRILERAHQAHLDRGKIDKAVRCAFRLGLMLMNAGEKARCSGWMARGERLLIDQHTQDCAEKGMLLLPGALGALSQGHADRAQKLFGQMATMGEKYNDPDLIVLGRLGLGQSIIELGHVASGIKLLDETMATLETEEVFPVIHGIVYCAVIETCRKVWDVERAQEWTSLLSRWCDAQPDIVPFRGVCMVRRAEVIQSHGEWSQALQEIQDACMRLTSPQGNPAAGEAYYRQAELHRLVGRFEEAEDCYREAARRGRKPQPGLALLRLAQCQYDAAEIAIRNTLLETKDIKSRAELLPGTVHIMIAVNQKEEALEAARELSHIAKRLNAPYLYAISAHCQGTVFLAEGKAKPALDQSQSALKVWSTLHLPYEAAHTRLLKALVYRELNDKDNSDAELVAAKWIFEQLNAMPDLARTNQLLNDKQNHKAYGLTLRELQVLRLVASGKTNKSVAGELFISERTVDRHVSNIFNKLDVSSRVEATAFAIKNRLLEKDL